MKIESEKVEKNSVKNTRIFCVVFFLIFISIAPLFLTFSGICYDEMRYLSRKEIIERVTSEAEDYESSESCIMTRHPFPLSGFDVFVNAFFGRMIYGANCMTYRLNEETATVRYGYYMTSVNACGIEGGDRLGEEISEEQYNKYIQIHRKYWKGL